MSEFNLWARDNNGESAANYSYLLGSVYEHSGNKKIYELINFSWNGETDCWQMVMQEYQKPSSVLVTRSFSNFFGNRKSGEKRFNKGTC